MSTTVPESSYLSPHVRERLADRYTQGTKEIVRWMTRAANGIEDDLVQSIPSLFVWVYAIRRRSVLMPRRISEVFLRVIVQRRKVIKYHRDREEAWDFIRIERTDAHSEFTEA